MKRKLSRAIPLSIVLATAFTFVFATASSACMYSRINGVSDAVNPDTAPNSLDAAIDGSDISSSLISRLSGSNQLGVAGTGLVAIVALVTGGVLLRSYLIRQKQSIGSTEPAIEPSEAVDFEASAFAIVVPPEALSALRKESTESELTQV